MLAQTSQEYEIASTATPGSAWEEDPPKLDYLCLPFEESLGLDLEDGGTTVAVEIERAKNHFQFEEFLQWYSKKYEGDIFPDYEWGRADGDQLEDLKDFIEWLVLIGDAFLKSGPNAATEYDVNWTLLGTIPYNKKWETALQSMVKQFHTCDLYVDGGGWILHFLDRPGRPHVFRLTPHKSRFPLKVFVRRDRVDPEPAGSKDMETCWETVQEHVKPHDAADGSESWDWNNAGWDLKAEWEDWCEQYEGDKATTADFTTDLSGDHEEPELIQELEDLFNCPLNKIDRHMFFEVPANKLKHIRFLIATSSSE